MAPVWRNSASHMRPAPTIAPVCETAAAARAAKRLILKATMGLLARAAFNAAARNFCGLRTVCTYGLHLQRDDLGGFVIGQVGDDVGQFQIDVVAGRSQLRQTDAACRRP